MAGKLVLMLAAFPQFIAMTVKGDSDAGNCSTIIVMVILILIFRFSACTTLELSPFTTVKVILMLTTEEG